MFISFSLKSVENLFQLNHKLSPPLSQAIDQFTETSFYQMFCFRDFIVLENRIKPGGEERAMIRGGLGGLAPEFFKNLRCSNIDIQYLLLPREKKISDYIGRKM